MCLDVYDTVTYEGNTVPTKWVIYRPFTIVVTLDLGYTSNENSIWSYINLPHIIFYDVAENKNKNYIYVNSMMNGFHL
jgi:hypothetical protein